MALLEIENVGKVYGDSDHGQRALADVSFNVAQGEFLSIVGPSGCGKTTLIKILAGLIKPTEGSVRLNGKEIDDVPSELAMVFQDYSRSLYPWMRVGANIALPLRVAGVARADRARRVRDSLVAVGLPDSANKYPWELSGGMQQRVAIARALAYRAPVLLMDEPFASVDAQTRAELEDLTRVLQQDFGTTVLFVTHDIDESVYVGDRVLVLRRSPGGVLTELKVELPPTRDQVGTRSSEKFVDLRRQVAQSVRDAAQAPVAAT